MALTVSTLCGVVLQVEGISTHGAMKGEPLGGETQCPGCARPQSECTDEYLKAHGGVFPNAVDEKSIEKLTPLIMNAIRKEIESGGAGALVNSIGYGLGR